MLSGGNSALNGKRRWMPPLRPKQIMNSFMTNPMRTKKGSGGRTLYRGKPFAPSGLGGG